MSMRIFSAALPLVLLAACGSAPEAPPAPKSPPVPATVEAASALARENRISCLVGGATDFGADCTIDRGLAKEGLMITVRHPDGGFRRLLVTKDGRGMIAADGAEPAKLTTIGKDLIEVAVAGDRYRFPATVKGPVAAKP